MKINFNHLSNTILREIGNFSTPQKENQAKSGFVESI